jgi:tripartite-type tricarboxylate transporter receptor subunit TctC
VHFTNGRRPAALLAAAALLMGVSSPAQAQTSLAQDYPNRAVTLVVPYPAGGGLDALARMLGQKLAERLGKPVVIENRTGAGTVIGAASVAKAAPDGYTIMLGTSTPFAITATLNKSLPYDPAKDFAPIALVSNAPFLLLVHPAQPVHSVADLIALAKAKPGQLSYGSAGPGSPQNLSFELLKTLTGINIVHVPYRGDGPALTDLVAGHIPTMFGEPTPILPLLKDGKVRALGVSSASRLPIAPDVPTIAEAGVPGFDLTSWQMIVAPAGTPQEIVDKLHVEVKKVLELPEVKAEFARTARITVDYPSVDDLQRFMRSEIVRLGKVVEQAGIARSQ